jgi:hypothetical protein
MKKKPKQSERVVLSLSAESSVLPQVRYAYICYYATILPIILCYILLYMLYIKLRTKLLLLCTCYVILPIVYRYILTITLSFIYILIYTYYQQYILYLLFHFNTYYNPIPLYIYNNKTHTPYTYITIKPNAGPGERPLYHARAEQAAHPGTEGGAGGAGG